MKWSLCKRTRKIISYDYKNYIFIPERNLKGFIKKQASLKKRETSANISCKRNNIGTRSNSAFCKVYAGWELHPE